MKTIIVVIAIVLTGCSSNANYPNKFALMDSTDVRNEETEMRLAFRLGFMNGYLKGKDTTQPFSKLFTTDSLIFEKIITLKK